MYYVLKSSVLFHFHHLQFVISETVSPGTDIYYPLRRHSNYLDPHWPLDLSRLLVSALIICYTNVVSLSLSLSLSLLPSPPSFPLSVLGAAICVFMIQFIRVPSLKISTLLLMGLLVYDVFWVSILVATSEKIPKILAIFDINSVCPCVC